MIDSFVSCSNVRVSFDHSPSLHPPPYPPPRLLITPWGQTTGFPRFNDDEEEDASPSSNRLLKKLLFEFSTDLSVSRLFAVCVFVPVLCFLPILKYTSVCVCMCVSILTLKLFTLLREDQSPCCYFYSSPAHREQRKPSRQGVDGGKEVEQTRKKKQADE